MIQVIVMTSDNQQWTIPPFWYQWTKYFNGLEHTRLTCGYTRIECDSNFYSIGKFKNYPANKWSDALIKVLDTVADEVFILMLDDYFLSRPVDTKAVQMIYDYMHQYTNVLKFDLADERLYSGTPPEGYNQFYWGYNTYDTLGYLDLIKSDPNSQYHMSLWGGMWRRDLLREVLVPGETAQQIEMAGRVNNHPDWLVLGTRQAPLRHVNVIQRGQWNYHDRSGIPGLKMTDRQELKERFGLDYE